MANKRLDALVTKPFLAALIILVINDHYLKYWFHTLLTGKISDFAGIFALSYLVTILARGPRLSHQLAIAIFFSWWKSPLSEPVIILLSEIWPWGFSRTVDLTDLIALVAIPLGAHLGARELNLIQSEEPIFLGRLVFVLTAIAFIATTKPIPREFWATFYKNYSVKDEDLSLCVTLDEDTIIEELKKKSYLAEKDYYAAVFWGQTLRVEPQNSCCRNMQTTRQVNDSCRGFDAAWLKIIENVGTSDIKIYSASVCDGSGHIIEKRDAALLVLEHLQQDFKSFLCSHSSISK